MALQNIHEKCKKITVSKPKISYHTRLKAESIAKVKNLAKQMNKHSTVKIAEANIIEIAIEMICKEKIDKLFVLYGETFKV
jgi:hypothetical protein